jgi:hypothetical protein
VNTSPWRLDRSKILADLRSLRESLAAARSSLMHYKDDRLDRDKLEPAARRVDDLMLMFAGNGADVVKGSIWIAEIQTGIDRVINPKAAAALQAARVDTESLLATMTPAASGERNKIN